MHTWSTGRVAYLRNVIFYEESITNGAMSGGAHPFIDPYQVCKASVDKFLDPRLELLEGTDDKPRTDDEETSDWTVAPHLLNLKSLMTWKMSPSDPDT